MLVRRHHYPSRPLGIDPAGKPTKGLRLPALREQLQAEPGVIPRRPEKKLTQRKIVTVLKASLTGASSSETPTVYYLSP